MITESFGAQSSNRGENILPKDFEEVKRIKPKVPGLKES
jgi:hypothetical protein